MICPIVDGTYPIEVVEVSRSWTDREIEAACLHFSSQFSRIAYEDVAHAFVVSVIRARDTANVYLPRSHYSLVIVNIKANLLSIKFVEKNVYRARAWTFYPRFYFKTSCTTTFKKKNQGYKYQKNLYIRATVSVLLNKFKNKHIFYSNINYDQTVVRMRQL